MKMTINELKTLIKETLTEMTRVPGKRQLQKQPQDAAKEAIQELCAQKTEIIREDDVLDLVCQKLGCDSKEYVVQKAVKQALAYDPALTRMYQSNDYVKKFASTH